MDDPTRHPNALSQPPPPPPPSPTLMSSTNPSHIMHNHSRPYPHQVGGHGQLAITPSGQVLKPARAKELKFYTYIHSNRLPQEMHWIRQVTPTFFGSIPISSDTNINIQDSNGPITTFTNTNSNSSSSQLRWHDNQKQISVDMSPWAAQMSCRNSSSTKPTRSIVLEDINHQFHLPCILDCKVGIRHYDDDASEEKRRRHIAKANATTSSKCGIRYIGMQSFKRLSSQDSNIGVFETRNKYHGRSLTEHDLVPEATWFFHDSHHVRIDCVKLLLEKLHRLRQFLGSQYHFFFYSSSLLVVYEGALPDITQPRVDVRMIDFAHTTLSNGRRDDGYLKGIDYLIKVLTQVVENEHLSNTQMPTKPVITEETEIEGLN